MAVELRGSVAVPIPVERAWDLWADVSRWPQWQAALVAVREASGPASEMGSTFVLDHGPRLKRHVRVLAAERPTRHAIEQTGLGIRDVTTVTFEATPEGTRITAVVFAHLGLVMRAAMLVDRGRSAREFQAELDRFAALAARTAPPPPVIGGIYVVTAGAWRRRVTVLGETDGCVHIRLHPGHLREKDPEDHVPAAPKPLSARQYLTPIPPPVRGDAAKLPGRGLGFALRDGGHGVAHLALTPDAWTDAQPRQVGHDALTGADREAVAAWQARGGPTVGADHDLDLTPLWTIRLSPPDRPEVWGAVKLLRWEMLRVHLMLYADRWATRPETVRPWALAHRPVEEDPSESGAVVADGPVSIGHFALAWNAFVDAKPGFAGVATLERDDLAGYRAWRDASGGTMTSLASLLPTEWGVRSADAEVVERQTREP